MRKKVKKSSSNVELGRGVIKDNFWAAVVTSSLFKQQVVPAKKGKGAYQRKAKFSKDQQESYLITA